MVQIVRRSRPRTGSGEQGWGVALICNRRGLERYFECMSPGIILQRYIPGIEAGVFYCRRPGREHGRIVSIAESIHPVEPCVDLRSDAERCILFGFTCHDAAYRDAQHWNSPQLDSAIDALGRALPGFFFGRFDIRASSVEALRRGEFAVIELNGVLSEPTQIYDPSANFALACRTPFRHWCVAFEIGAENRAMGAVPTRVSELVQLTAAKIGRQVASRRLRNLARSSSRGVAIDTR